MVYFIGLLGKGYAYHQLPAGTWLCKIDYREEFGKEGGRNGGLAEFRLKKRTGFTGRNGVEVIKRLYSKDVVTQKYVDLVEAL